MWHAPQEQYRFLNSFWDRIKRQDSVDYISFNVFYFASEPIKVKECGLEEIFPSRRSCIDVGTSS
jgi:hypothetical protein